MVITGAGPGIMQAANEGAGSENSFGVNIMLPFEQTANPFIDGDIIECPLHAGQFHIPTGKAMSPPVTEDLKTFAVKVEGDDLYVEVPKD